MDPPPPAHLDGGGQERELDLGRRLVIEAVDDALEEVGRLGDLAAVLPHEPNQRRPRRRLLRLAQAPLRPLQHGGAALGVLAQQVHEHEHGLGLHVVHVQVQELGELVEDPRLEAPRQLEAHAPDGPDGSPRHAHVHLGHVHAQLV